MAVGNTEAMGRGSFHEQRLLLGAIWSLEQVWRLIFDTAQGDVGRLLCFLLFALFDFLGGPSKVPSSDSPFLSPLSIRRPRVRKESVHLKLKIVPIRSQNFHRLAWVYFFGLSTTVGYG